MGVVCEGKGSEGVDMMLGKIGNCVAARVCLVLFLKVFLTVITDILSCILLKLAGAGIIGWLADWLYLIENLYL